MFRIRQNLANVIFVLDLSQTRTLSLLGSLSEHFVARGFPVRWGFVPEGEGDSESINTFSSVQCSLLTGLKMARLVYYINSKYGRDRMIAFVQGVCRSRPFAVEIVMTRRRSHVVTRSEDYQVYHGK